MTTFVGYSADQYEQGLFVGNPALGNFPINRETLIGYDRSKAVFGAEVENQPVVEYPRSWEAFTSPEFGFLDFYNHIHVQYNVIALGAVVSTQTVPFTVFNAFFVKRTLVDVTEENAEGLTLTQPAAPPYDFASLEEKSYSLSVSPFGPASVDAHYTFEFDIRSYDLRVTGTRVIGWRWEPNWANGVLERLEWLTDVMIAYSGVEQRRQLRFNPRQFWEFDFDVQGQQRRIFENALYNWGARVFALPCWPDIEVLTETFGAGATSLSIDTTTRQFRVGELIMFISEDNSNNETLEISELTDSTVTFTQPTSFTWTPGTRVYPARVAKLDSDVNMSRFNRSYAFARVSFRCEQQATLPWTALPAEPLHRTYPVLIDLPDWKEFPQESYARKQAVLDLMVGQVYTDDEAGVPWEVFAYRWLQLDRDGVKRLRQWLYARAGQAKCLWIPTFCEDLVVVTTITNVATNIDFEFAGLVAYCDGVHRRDIRIELTDGTVYYRRISAPQSVIEGQVERVTIEGSLGRTIQPTEVARVSWMALCRLDADAIEIQWETPYVAEAATPIRSFNNAV